MPKPTALYVNYFEAVSERDDKGNATMLRMRLHDCNVGKEGDPHTIVVMTPGTAQAMLDVLPKLLAPASPEEAPAQAEKTEIFDKTKAN